MTEKTIEHHSLSSCVLLILGWPESARALPTKISQEKRSRMKITCESALSLLSLGECRTHQRRTQRCEGSECWSASANGQEKWQKPESPTPAKCDESARFPFLFACSFFFIYNSHATLALCQVRCKICTPRVTDPRCICELI